MENKVRCKWCNLKNDLYVKYHDEEWCQPNFDDKYLFKMLRVGVDVVFFLYQLCLVQRNLEFQVLLK